MLSKARPLTDVKGIGEPTAANLVGVGIDSVEALAAASPEEISACPGFGLARADAVKRAANALLEPSTREEQSTAPPEPARKAAEKVVINSTKQPKSKKEKPKMAKKKTTSKKKLKKAEQKKKAKKAEQKKA